MKTWPWGPPLNKALEKLNSELIQPELLILDDPAATLKVSTCLCLLYAADALSWALKWSEAPNAEHPDTEFLV